MQLDAAASRLRARRPDQRLRELGARLARLRRDLDRAAQRALKARRDRLEGLGRTLAAVGPEGTIARGYAVLRGPDDAVVTRVGQVETGDPVSAQLSDGMIDLRVERRRPR
jgi:exodeoxyribonuclease VII large subunit